MTKEEILNSHPFHRVWYEKSIPICTKEHALWAMEEYANQKQVSDVIKELKAIAESFGVNYEWHLNEILQEYEHKTFEH